MKTYQEPTLEFVRMLDSDIIRTSNDPNAVFNAYDVLGDDPGFWREL